MDAGAPGAGLLFGASDGGAATDWLLATGGKVNAANNVTRKMYALLEDFS
jgi:hypothetical protein